MSAPSATVLYDVPGPKARRLHVIIGAVGILAILGGLAYAAWRLNEGGQFEAEKWSPLFNPSDEVFGDVWSLIGEGIRNTLIAAAFAIVFSSAAGAALGISRMLLGKYARLPIVGVIELFRGLPVVIAIYFASRVLPSIGVDLSEWPLTDLTGDGLWYLVIGLTAYNSVVFAEILRAGVAALPKGQREAAAAIGLTRVQSMWLVELPQAIRIMLPALVSQLVVVLKDTSLAAVLGIYGELLQQGKFISLNLENPIQTYLLIGALFILVNMTLSWLAHVLQRKMATSSS